VRNYRPEPAEVRLKIDVMVNGEVVHPEQRTLHIPKRVVKREKDDNDVLTSEDDQWGRVTEKFVLPPLDMRGNIVLRAWLDNHHDDFALDDQAWLVVGSVRKAKVLYVGPGNPILSAFFEQEAATRIAGYDPRTYDKKDESRKLARGGEVDLVIFDRGGRATESEMPLANSFFIGDSPPPWRKTGKTIKNPSLVAGKKDHPLLPY